MGLITRPDIICRPRGRLANDELLVCSTVEFQSETPRSGGQAKELRGEGGGNGEEGGVAGIRYVGRKCRKCSSCVVT